MNTSPFSCVNASKNSASSGDPSHRCLVSHSHGRKGLILRILPACCQAPAKNIEVASQTKPLLRIRPPKQFTLLSCL